MKYLIHSLSFLLSIVLILSAWVMQSTVALFWIKFFTVLGVVVIPLALIILCCLLFVDPNKVAKDCHDQQVGPAWYGVSVLIGMATLVFYVWHGFIAYAVAQVAVLLLGAISHIVRGVFAAKHKPFNELSEKEIALIKEALDRR